MIGGGLVTMVGTDHHYSCSSNGRKAKDFRILLQIVVVLFIEFLFAGRLSYFGNSTHPSGGKCVLLVQAFSLISPSAHSSSLPSASLPIRVRSTVREGLPWTLFCKDECIILDDNHSPSNATIQHADIINILSRANYMDTKTKTRFLEALTEKIPNDLKDIGGAHFNESSLVEATACETTTNSEGGAETKYFMGTSNIQFEANSDIFPTIEGLWEDNGGPFHASGAWQVSPLLMKGAFLDDIKSCKEDNPFPSWKEIIELACDEAIDSNHLNLHHENTYEEIFGFGNDESVTCIGVDDDENYENEEQGHEIWGDEDESDDGDEGCDNPPSRLIQYSWPRQDGYEDSGSGFHNADVNSNWLDTFQIKEFGPFNTPDCLEALLRSEDMEDLETYTARTLLVNDVDRWFPKLSDWMDRRFNDNNVLPARWRRDDAQISLSHPMGGIGPHVDDYDVFLIQLEGERTWDVLWEGNSSNYEKSYDTSKVSVRDEMNCILPESSSNGVRILNITKLQSLENHRCGETKTRLVRLHLRPGDCLYLPPRVLHCGTAIKASHDCMTLSVGCRAPSAMELLDGLSNLIKNSVTNVTPKRKLSADSIFPSDDAIQAFYKRYTNDNANRDESILMNDTDDINEVNGFPKTSPLHSSWLSPQVKNDMKNLVLEAVRTALEDDENILDPLVGRFVTKSNRVEEEFHLGVHDNSIPSFSSQKNVGRIAKDGESSVTTWENTTSALIEVFGTRKSNKDPDFVLRRAEGVAFAWSSVYHKKKRSRIYRLYAQGRPPFEVREVRHGVIEEESDNPSELVRAAPNSTVGRLLDRIANGPPLNRAFVVEELQISVELTEKRALYTTTQLLHDLVEEGLLYREHCDRLEAW